MVSHGVESVAAVLGIPDLGQRLFARDGHSWAGTENVRDLVEPTALLSGLREHLAQRTPEPERAIAHGQHRGAHPAACAVTQQVRPITNKSTTGAGS